MSNRHDEQIDRLLTALHRRGGGGVSPECLDAETLAAWIDDRLAGPALARAEEHAASCARCQSMLAVMARTADMEAETQAAGGATPRSKFWRMLPWAAPLTAAAAAAALYVAVRPDALRSPEAGQFRTPTVARREVPAEPAPAAEKSSQEATHADSAAGPSRDEKAAGVATRSRANSAVAPGERRPGRADADVARDKEENPPPPPPLPEAKDLQRELRDAPKPAAPAAPAPQNLPQVTEQLRVEPPASARSAATRPVASAYGQSGALAETVTITSAPAPIPTPDPRIHWQVVDGRVVQLSRDGGTTWTTQDTGASARLTGGAAPSAMVCWIVGAAGTVLRTTDGRTWARIEFPERTDLASVRATSADRATVTTTDGRMFSTTDGGKTWTRRSP